VWIFFIFWHSNIHVSPTSVVSSLSPPGAASPSAGAVVRCHTSFPLNQDEFTTSTSTYENASSRRLPSWAKIEALNLHHSHWPSFPDRPTPTLHCYKKDISILITFPITQSHLHFSSSLDRAPHHCCSLSPSSHAHRYFVQQHLWWWTNRLSFTSQITYRHMNSCKKIF
jgi:hypothetical protein